MNDGSLCGLGWTTHPPNENCVHGTHHHAALACAAAAVIDPCPEHGAFRWEHVNGETRVFCPICKRYLAPPPTLPERAP